MKKFLLYAALLFSAGVSAQKKGQALVDSLLIEIGKSKEDTSKVLLYNQVGVAYMNFAPREEFKYMELGIALAEKLHWKKGIANLNNNLGLMVGDTGDNKGARQRFEKVLPLYKELGSKINQVNALNNIGRTYQRESNFSEAIKYFFEALAIAEELRNYEKISLVCTNITVSFLNQSNFDKAEEYAQLSLKNGLLAKYPLDIGKAQLLLGNIKLRKQDTAAARGYLEQSLATYEEMGNLPLQASVLTSLADLDFPDYPKMIAKLEEAKNIYEQVGEVDISTIDNLTNLGYYWYQYSLHSQEPKRSLYLRKGEGYLLKAVALCKDQSNTQGLVPVYEDLSELERTKGNYKAALDYYRQSVGINDSLTSQDKKNEIAGLEGKHKLDQKESELAVNKLKLVNQRKTLAGLAIGLVLIIVIAGLLYRQSESRKKTNTTLMVLNNQLDEANKLKATFFGILSHDLRSPISNLIHFLHLQKDAPDLLSEADKVVHQQQISDSAEDLLNNMESMLIWSKGQMEHFKPNIRTVPISDLFAHVERFFGSVEHVRLDFRPVSPDLVLSTDENYLQIIMQNLTSNAIKALRGRPNGVVEWSAWKDGDRTVLSIKDNGIGIGTADMKVLYGEGKEVNGKTGLGLHLVRDLAKAIRCNISVEAQEGIGTRFVLAA